MKLKYMLIAGVAAGMLAGFTGGAFANPKPGRVVRLKHADRNKDGQVTAREWKKAKQRVQKTKAEVDTKWEARADKNDDGVVQPAEARKAKTTAYIKHKSDVNRKWEARADTDKNGKVSAKELRAYHRSVMDKNGDGKVDKKERTAYWTRRKAKVNTRFEKLHDTDGDGWINGSEAQELLRDRLLIIKTHGRAKVNTDLEREYDANNDGVIDREEAAAIKDALGLD
jgi:Ca2+-binding EF-hand superfamily protein